MYHRQFRPGDLVWFDPGVGYVLPGEVTEYHTAAQVRTFSANLRLWLVAHTNSLKLSLLQRSFSRPACNRHWPNLNADL